jgi:inorganic pyrophosphatase
MQKLASLETFDHERRLVHVVVETPKGARSKVAFDPKLQAFVLKKILPEGMSFPFDFGFIPSTIGGDGDPLDVLVLMDEPVGTGVVVPSRLIGLIDATQTEKDGETVENARLIAISASSLLLSDVRRLSALPAPVLAQIEHFFVSYNEQEGRVFTPTGRHGPRKAMHHVEAGQRRYHRRK